MEKSVVISGEASETDSDEDVSNAKKTPLITPSVQGSVITGEDSESEDENSGSISSAVSALNLPQTSQTQASPSESGYNTLLHRKLRESNAQLHSDIEHFSNEIVSEAYRTITITDQNLLKSQISLQGALSAMKSLSNNSVLIKNKLQTLLSAKFLPKMNIPASSQKD